MLNMKNESEYVLPSTHLQRGRQRHRAWRIGALTAALAFALILSSATFAESSKPKGRQSVNNKAPSKQRARSAQRQTAPRQAAPQRRSAPRSKAVAPANQSKTRRNSTEIKRATVQRTEPRRGSLQREVLNRQSRSSRGVQSSSRRQPQSDRRDFKPEHRQSDRRKINVNLQKKSRRDVNINVNVNKSVRRNVNIQTPEHQRYRDRHDRRDRHQQRQRQRHYKCHHEHWHHYDCSRFTFNFYYGSHAYYAPYYAPRVIYSTHQVIIDPYPVHYRHYVKSSGWDLLADGQAYRALDAFQTQTYRYPDASLPKAGMALARALLDQDYAAAEDLREAFRRDPEALSYLPVSRALDRQLLVLIHQYEEHRLSEPHNRDWRFMLAALSYFRHDYDRAAYEISYLFEYGNEVGYATKNLNDLIYDAQYEL